MTSKAISFAMAAESMTISTGVWLIAAILALLPAYAVWHSVSRMASQPVTRSPRETTVSLVGTTGTIKSGIATHTHPAEAIFIDRTGNPKTVCVCTLLPSQQASPGESVRLVEQGRNGEASLVMPERLI